MQSIEEILNFLKRKETNVKEISKETGIKVDRLYSWRNERGTPKAEDTKILLEWAKKFEEIPKTGEEIQGETEFKSKYIALLEKTNDFLTNKINELSLVVNQVKENIEELMEVKKMATINHENLDILTKNHLTAHAMSEAYHEEIVDLILRSGKHAYSPNEKARLISSVHTKGFDKMLVFSEKGISEGSRT